MAQCAAHLISESRLVVQSVVGGCVQILLAGKFPAAVFRPDKQVFNVESGRFHIDL